VQKEGEHGKAFAYKTVNADVLGWVIARVTGKSIGNALSEHIWSKLGAEHDAYFTVDSIGTEFAGGGLNTNLRDMARFGEMMRNQGRVGTVQVVPQSVVSDIAQGADPAQFAQGGYPLLQGWSYRNMWWVSHNSHGAYMARGIYGQSLYIDPKAEMVIARFGSHPVAPNSANDAFTLPAFAASSPQKPWAQPHGGQNQPKADPRPTETIVVIALPTPQRIRRPSAAAKRHCLHRLPTGCQQLLCNV
jgi:CubicO group peptidase (beta-lactamase class C family)